ncbi:MAG: hypothetical protein WCL19_10345 [Verrucomicrobiota bacterium]
MNYIDGSHSSSGGRKTIAGSALMRIDQILRQANPYPANNVSFTVRDEEQITESKKAPSG